MKVTNSKFGNEILKKLGVDPLKGKYSFDGENLTVEGFTDADIKKVDDAIDAVYLDSVEKKRKSDAIKKESDKQKDIADMESDTDETSDGLIKRIKRLERIVGRL